MWKILVYELWVIFQFTTGKAFLGLRDVTFPCYCKNLHGWNFFCFVLVVLFRLRLEDTSYIQVAHSTQEDKRTNSPVLHLHRALALHSSSGSTDFNPLQTNQNPFQVLGPHVQFHSNSFVCCYAFWGEFDRNNPLPTDEPTHTKDHKTRLCSSKPPLWVWMKSPIAAGSSSVTRVKFVQ